MAPLDNTRIEISSTTRPSPHQEEDSDSGLVIKTNLKTASSSPQSGDYQGLPKYRSTPTVKDGQEKQQRVQGEAQSAYPSRASPGKGKGSNNRLRSEDADQSAGAAEAGVSRELMLNAAESSNHRRTAAAAAATTTTLQRPTKPSLNRTNSDSSSSNSFYDDIIATDGPSVGGDSSVGAVNQSSSSSSLTGNMITTGLGSGESLREAAKKIMRRKDLSNTTIGESTTTTTPTDDATASLASNSAPPPPPPASDDENILTQLEEGRRREDNFRVTDDETASGPPPIDFSGSLSDFQKLGILTIGEASADGQEEEIVFLNNNNTSNCDSSTSFVSMDDYSTIQQDSPRNKANEILMHGRQITPKGQKSNKNHATNLMIFQLANNSRDNSDNNQRAEEGQGIINDDEEANYTKIDSLMNQLVLSDIDTNDDTNSDDDEEEAKEEQGKEDEEESGAIHNHHHGDQDANNNKTNSALHRHLGLSDDGSNDNSNTDDNEEEDKRYDEENAIHQTDHVAADQPPLTIPDLITMKSGSSDDDGCYDSEAEDQFPIRQLSSRRWRIPSSFNPPSDEDDDDDEDVSEEPSLSVDDLDGSSHHQRGGSEYESSEEWNLPAKFRRSKSQPRRFYSSSAADPPSVTVHPNSQRSLTTSSNHSSGGFRPRTGGSEDFGSNPLFSSTTSSQRQIAPYRPRRFLSIRAQEFDDYVLREEIKQEERQRRKTVFLTIVCLCVIGITGALFLYYVFDMGKVQEE